MSKKRIQELENENAEIAKEILLNESAIYEAQKEISDIETELLNDPTIQQHLQFLRLLIERIEVKNQAYRTKIYNNDFEINSLENENT